MRNQVIGDSGTFTEEKPVMGFVRMLVGRTRDPLTAICFKVAPNYKTLLKLNPVHKIESFSLEIISFPRMVRLYWVLLQIPPTKMQMLGAFFFAASTELFSFEVNELFVGQVSCFHCENGSQRI
jgi:hypothetical protein